MAKKPAKECKDTCCPFHGTLIPRGREFIGTLISKDVHKSGTIQFERRFFVPKYERHEKRRTRIRVHNPPCIDAQIGDRVRVQECRPLSKTKNFVIIESLGRDITYRQKAEAVEEAKFVHDENKPKDTKKDNVE